MHRHLILLCSTSFSYFTVPYFTPTEANFSEGRILEANFQKKSVVYTAGPPLRRVLATPISHEHGLIGRGVRKYLIAVTLQTVVPRQKLWCPICPQQE